MRASLFHIALLVFVPVILCGQTSKRVLFLGNSYTSFYNLPQLVSNIALSMNDSLLFDSNTPGGYTLEDHSSNTTSINKIKTGNWDYVVLQEQSQRPSFPDSEVETGVYPYAHFLDSMINTYNNCCETIFYMTWGRKNGDASNCSWFPPVCTYQGMDSLLYVRYMKMAVDNDAMVSPVGAVWKHIRQQYPAIELYQADQSHPSAAGSYAAACCFYTAIFRKDPTNISYNFSLSSTDASNIRNAVKAVMYDTLLKWQIGKFDVRAAFNFSYNTNKELHFNSLSENADSLMWDFGDNSFSTEPNPVHVYQTAGNFNVTLTAGNCNAKVNAIQQVLIEEEVLNAGFYPNPVSNYFYIGLQPNMVKELMLFNSLGQRMAFNKTIEAARIRIDMTTMSKGIYYLKIFSDNKWSTQKIIKE